LDFPPVLDEVKCLSCERVSKHYGGIAAVQNVSCRLDCKQIVAVIGPNGAGKTTLINILSGFVRPESGRLLLDGYDITGRPPHDVAVMGVCRTFQEVRLLREATVVENVLLARSTQAGESIFGAFGGASRRQEVENRRNCQELLDFVGLEGCHSHLVSALSFGQQKLVSLACCLATGARFLMLDEPFAGLHRREVNDVAVVLRRLQQEGRAILFIEHDVAAVRELADSVLVMDEGRILAQGPIDEVLRRSDVAEAYLA